MTDYDNYFASLMRRKRAGVWYRDLWLYPRICRHLSGSVLDIGCGIGDMVRHRPQTVGVDVNPKAVAFCQSQGLRVQLMQPDRLPFTDCEFDGAVLDNVLEHLERPEPLLAEVRRVLKEAGSFVVGVPGERGFDSDSDHKRHYPEAALVHAIRGAGFQLSRIFHQPFRSRLLDRHFRYYAIYGVFRRL
jgi:SAM-dependent methyltransferase